MLGAMSFSYVPEECESSGQHIGAVRDLGTAVAGSPDIERSRQISHLSVSELFLELIVAQPGAISGPILKTMGPAVISGAVIRI